VNMMVQVIDAVLFIVTSLATCSEFSEVH